MAKLTDKDVLKLAQLSKLQITAEEVERFKSEISTILKYVEQLQAVSLDGVEPTNQVTGLKNVMRDDVVQDYGVTTKALMKNVPDMENGSIKVKRVMQ